MLKSSLLVIVLSTSNLWATQAVRAEENRLVKGFPGLPADARRVVERLAECNHWAGETGDNPPERAREIFNAVTKLRCDRIETDVAFIRAKYHRNTKVKRALAAAQDF